MQPSPKRSKHDLQTCPSRLERLANRSDWDDDSFLTQPDILQQADELNRPVAQEVARIAPNARLRASPAVLTEDKLTNLMRDLDQLNCQHGQKEKELERTRTQLLTKEGEIKILRENMASFEREKAKFQVDICLLRQQHTTEVSEMKRQQKIEFDRMQTELFFSNKEKEDLKCRIVKEQDERDRHEQSVQQHQHTTTGESCSFAVPEHMAHSSRTSFDARHSFYAGTNVADAMRPSTSASAAPFQRVVPTAISSGAQPTLRFGTTTSTFVQTDARRRRSLVLTGHLEHSEWFFALLTKTCE